MNCDDLKRIIGDKKSMKELPENFDSQIFEPYLKDQFVFNECIGIPIAAVKKRAQDIAKAKMGEAHYKTDSVNLDERFLCGQAAELACERKLGLPEGSIYDSSIGDSIQYNHPDLIKLGCRIGCKAAKVPNAPMINPKCDYPNIICLVQMLDGHGNPNPCAVVCVVGIAQPEVVRKFSSPALIRIAENPNKMGFYGFDYLEPLPEPITSFKEEYQWLSNFSRSRVDLDGVKYPSVEHAYQAAKTNDAVWRQKILDAPTEGKAKKIGKQVPMRSEWEDVKLEVMENLLRQKFAKGSLLAKKLMATGIRQLVEGNWWGDTFWGVCKGKGENHLGKLLMKLRMELMRSLDS